MANQTHRGRPRAARKPGERAPLSLRVPSELFERLDEAAKGKGRPLSNEAEMRLEASFHNEEIVARTLAFAYGDQLTGVILTLATAIKDLGPHAGFYATGDLSPWLDNPFAFDQMVIAINRILEAMRPEGDPKATIERKKLGDVSPEASAAQASPGITWANAALSAVAGFPHGVLYENAIGRLRPMLGPIADRVRKYMRQGAVRQAVP